MACRRQDTKVICQASGSQGTFHTEQDRLRTRMVGGVTPASAPPISTCRL